MTLLTLIRYTMIYIYSRVNVWKREKGYRALRAGAQVQADSRNAGRVVYQDSVGRPQGCTRCRKMCIRDSTYTFTRLLLCMSLALTLSLSLSHLNVSNYLARSLYLCHWFYCDNLLSTLSHTHIQITHVHKLKI